MSMLAERKRKTKWLNPGRQALWKQDVGGMKFGRELMEKMGWKIGQGLGVNNQGITEPLKISLKNDNKGMGYKGSDNEWIQQQSEFDSLLNKLSSSEPFPNKVTSQDSKKDSIRSLEERSKLSKARLQYNKFTRGKDFTKYSKKDIECILGCKEKDLSPCVENREDDINCKPHVEDTGLVTINSGSMMDYFAKKMQHKTDSKICFLPEEQTSIKNLSVKENENVKEKELKKKDKSKSKIRMENSKNYHVEDLYCNELVLNDSNDNDIKSDADKKCDGNKIEDNPKFSPDRYCCEDATTRKNSKNKSKEQEDQFLLELEGDMLNEKLKEKKKKRKKNKCIEKHLEVLETLDNQKVNENNEGHSQHNEEYDLIAKEKDISLDNDEELDVTIQRKKKKKKKRLKEMENTEHEEVKKKKKHLKEMENTEHEEVKKKKKRLKEMQNSEYEEVKKKKANLDNFSDTEIGITRNKEQYLEEMKMTPNSSSLLYKKELLKTPNTLENIQHNKILNLIYCMNTEKFNGSNLALLNGYGIIRCKTES